MSGATEGARERILAAAVERIAGDGIDAMRIARIAMDAGVSTSLVHYHFETREALLAEALEYSFELAGDVRTEGRATSSTTSAGCSRWSTSACPIPACSSATGSCGSSCGCARCATPSCAPPRRGSTGACATGSPRGSATAADRGDPEPLADRAIALCDGFGVRVLVGELDIEYAREQVWAFLAAEIGLDRALVAS